MAEKQQPYNPPSTDYIEGQIAAILSLQVAIFGATFPDLDTRKRITEAASGSVKTIKTENSDFRNGFVDTHEIFLKLVNVEVRK